MSKHIHFVIGSTGAGKTTYAAKLAREIGGIPFAIDQWMMTLFHPDLPDTLTYDWMYERVLRVQAQIWELAVQTVRANVSPILEIGLTTSADRARFLVLAQTADIPLHIHNLDIPRDIRWQRVDARNREETDSYSFEVTREMFNHFENLWEPPREAEINGWNATVTHIKN